MEPFRLRKYRGPETWRRVKAAYIAGEAGPAVALRFDVGLANLRKKARAEGWTRARLAAAHDLPPIRGEDDPPAPDLPLGLGAGSEDPPSPADPHDAVYDAVARAAGALSAGRAGEASALLKAAGEMMRLITPEPAPASPAREPPAADPLVFLNSAEGAERVHAEAERLAREMLLDTPQSLNGRDAAFAYHWRAAKLGPDAAAADFAHGVSHGWAAHLWDAEGRLRPLPEPPSPETRMVEQHLRACAWKEGREGG